MNHRYEIAENFIVIITGKCRVYHKRKKGNTRLKANWVQARLNFNRYLCNLT